MSSSQTPEPHEVGSAGRQGESSGGEAGAGDSVRPRRLLLQFGWLWVLLAGIGGYLLLLRTLVVTQNPNFLPSLILLGSIVVPTTV